MLVWSEESYSVSRHQSYLDFFADGWGASDNMLGHNSSIDEYLETVAPNQKAALERVRVFVKKTVPEAEESISYGMPAFKYHKKPLLYYAAFKDHMSIFPTTGPIKTLANKLEGFTVTKGTIHFTEKQALPDALLKEILLTRVADIAKK